MNPDLEVDVHAAARAIESGEAQVVDVREDDEREAGHAPGSLHVPLGELAARSDELASDRPVLVVCRVGGRSAHGALALRDAGLDAWSVAGGMLAWQAEGLPMAPEGGVVAAH